MIWNEKICWIVILVEKDICQTKTFEAMTVCSTLSRALRRRRMMVSSPDRMLEPGPAKQCIEVKNKYVPLSQYGYNEQREGFLRSFCRSDLQRTPRAVFGSD